MSVSHTLDVPGGRSSERRSQILDHAVLAFDQDGYHATSMAAIALRLGITKPILYRHFGSKEGLYLGAVSHVVDSLTARVQAARADGELADLDSDEVVTRLDAALCDERLPLSIVLCAATVSPRALRQVDAEVERLRTSVAAAVLAARPVPPSRAAVLARLLTLLATQEGTTLSRGVSPTSDGSEREMLIQMLGSALSEPVRPRECVGVSC